MKYFTIVLVVSLLFSGLFIDRCCCTRSTSEKSVDEKIHDGIREAKELGLALKAADEKYYRLQKQLLEEMADLDDWLRRNNIDKDCWGA